MDKVFLVKCIELLFNHINIYYHDPSFKGERKKLDKMSCYDILGDMELFSSDLAGYATKIIKKSNRGIDIAELINEKISGLLDLHRPMFEWVIKNESCFPCLCQYIGLNVSLAVMLLKYMGINGDK